MRSEAQIIFETPHCWVSRDRHAYTVWLNGVTCSTSDSAYANNPDGLSLALARCKYLNRRKQGQCSYIIKP